MGRFAANFDKHMKKALEKSVRKRIQPTAITEKLTAVPETNITPALLNIEQASLHFGVTTWTIRRLIENKELACAKIGKRFIVKREDLDMVWEKKAAA